MAKKITNIVFTKNRPLQLHGYLESLYRFLPEEIISTYILYKPELFSSEYEQLFSQFSNCKIIRETDFHSNLLEIIGNVETEYILFGIDDVVYFDSIDFDVVEFTFRKAGDELLGFSLRMDPRQCAKNFEAGNITELNIFEEPVYTVDWTEGNTSLTRYPFELCATVYHSSDVKKIISGTMNNNPIIKRLFLPASGLVKELGRIIPQKKILKKFGYFYSPNNFESWCCRHVQKNKDKYASKLAFQKICATAIQVNIVNTTTFNAFDGNEELTVEALNKKYCQGYRFDIEHIVRNKPKIPGCGREYFNISKKIF